MDARISIQRARCAAVGVVLVALTLFNADESSAQEPGARQAPDNARRGAIRSLLRLINKLSGPGPFLGAGVDVGFSLGGIRLGFPVSVLSSVDPETPVDLRTIMVTADFAYGPFELGSGFGPYRFSGGGIQPLTTYPVRQVLAYRFPGFGGRIQANVAANLFRGFTDSQFAPLNVSIEPTSTEVVYEVGLSVELLPGVDLGPASRSGSRLLVGMLTIAATTTLKYVLDRNNNQSQVSVILP